MSSGYRSIRDNENKEIEDGKKVDDADADADVDGTKKKVEEK